MGRITINLSERDHLAFKLLALQQNRKIVTLVHEAMQQYLDRNGAYLLSIQRKDSQDNQS